MKATLIILVVLVLAVSVLAKKPPKAKAKKVNCKKGNASWTPCVNGSMRQTFTPSDVVGCNATVANLTCPSVMQQEKNGCIVTHTDAIQECATGTVFTRTYSSSGTCSHSAKPAKKLPCSKPYKSNADRAAKKAEKLAKKQAKKAGKNKQNKRQKKAGKA
ncbi:uncharacterized protein LOC127849553 [Dreissena polymorpha]|uniref:Uncharacterized protein n=1 Tax=Dreissena polymorpha TaxID=45954 RepID=A0A9D4D1E3_DREPO|nr:uncharacterized protein LOC127849553 [Dreissena polymorpha]XP_052238216.1 uncharacterized protein LOC127849553 [Dreissena polymorpha]XP_052238217.1 uncharacterized protein LOC127849553 [Dreissena polymorpha]KAH3736205.1 hypothetical protein DPMN_042768 [Dreissena polymorpha]